MAEILQPASGNLKFQIGENKKLQETPSEKFKNYTYGANAFAGGLKDITDAQLNKRLMETAIDAATSLDAKFPGYGKPFWYNYTLNKIKNPNNVAQFDFTTKKIKGNLAGGEVNATILDEANDAIDAPIVEDPNASPTPTPAVAPSPIFGEPATPIVAPSPSPTPSPSGFIGQSLKQPEAIPSPTIQDSGFMAEPVKKASATKEPISDDLKFYYGENASEAASIINAKRAAVQEAKRLEQSLRDLKSKEAVRAQEIKSSQQTEKYNKAKTEGEERFNAAGGPERKAAGSSSSLKGIDLKKSIEEKIILRKIGVDLDSLTPKERAVVSDTFQSQGQVAAIKIYEQLLIDKGIDPDKVLIQQKEGGGAVNLE